MIRLFFDGACTPVNPGGVGTWGFVLDLDDGYPINGCGVQGENSTNNIAEYCGLMMGLQQLAGRGIKNETIQIMGDSALVVNMVNGAWGRKNPHKKAPHLLPYLEECRSLLFKIRQEGNHVTLKWIPRELNEQADALTKLEYKYYANRT